MLLTALMTVVALVLATSFVPTVALPPIVAGITLNNMGLPSVLPTMSVTGITTPPPPPWSILSTIGPMTSDSSSLTSYPTVSTSEPVTSVIPTSTSLMVSSSSAWSPGAAATSELTTNFTTVSSPTISPASSMTTPAVPSSTMSPAPSATRPQTPEHQVKSRVIKIVAIVVPTVVVLLLILGALGYWLMSRRRERKRVDSLARKANWFDQEYIDNIKKQFGCLDQDKVGVLDRSSPSNAVDGEEVVVRKVRAPDRGNDNQTPSQASKRHGVWLNPLGMHSIGPSATDLNSSDFELSSLSSRSSTGTTGTVVVSRAKESDPEFQDGE